MFKLIVGSVLLSALFGGIIGYLGGLVGLGNGMVVFLSVLAGIGIGSFYTLPTWVALKTYGNTIVNGNTKVS